MPDNSAAEFGAHLRDAREARGLTVGQLAGITKISVHVLDALEHGDMSRLPGGLFSRGFVRAYAREVGLDPERTVRQFLDLFPEPEPPAPAEPAESAVAIDLGGPRSSPRLTVLGVSVALFVLYLVFGTRLLSPRSSDDDALQAPSARSDPAEPDLAPPQAQAPAAQPEALPSIGTSQPRPSEEPSAAPTTAMSPKTLRLEILATGPCWVLAHADGTVAAARLMASGERVTVEADREVALSVGDAGSFSFTINGAAGRPLGASGEVVKVRITPDNHQSYLLR